MLKILPPKSLATLLILSFMVSMPACSKEGDSPKTGPSPSDFNLENGKKISFALTWITPPKAEAFTAARLKFTPLENLKIEKISISRFKPWMPSMGHGTYEDEQKITPQPDDPSVLMVENIFFTMSGPWEIEISAAVNDQPVQFKVPVEVAP